MPMLRPDVGRVLILETENSGGLPALVAAVQGGSAALLPPTMFEPIGRLGPVSFIRCRTSTPGLST